MKQQWALIVCVLIVVVGLLVGTYIVHQPTSHSCTTVHYRLGSTQTCGP